MAHVVKGVDRPRYYVDGTPAADSPALRRGRQIELGYQALYREGDQVAILDRYVPRRADGALRVFAQGVIVRYRPVEESDLALVEYAPPGETTRRSLYHPSDLAHWSAEHAADLYGRES